MTSTNETSFFPILNGSIFHNFVKIEYEIIERFRTGMIKAKFLQEKNDLNAPSIIDKIPDIFYIDITHGHILNEFNRLIACNKIVKNRPV